MNTDYEKIGKISVEVTEELIDATSKHGSFNSAHEGYSVILEELDELWDQVKLKRAKRDKANMQKECVQIAAMAMRFYHDLL